MFDVFYPGNFEFGQIKKIPAPDEVGGDQFGTSVALHGTTLVAGKPGHGTGAGRAYVFSRDEGGEDNWGQLATLTVLGDTAANGFGASLAIHGDTIAVGAKASEAAYVFEKPGAGWADMTQTATLSPSDGGTGDEFGCALSVSGDSIAVGSHKHGGGAGAAYVFVRPGGGWADATQTAKLTASDADSADRFGFSVSIDADVVVVGAPQDQSGNGLFPNSFPVYVYEKSAGGWVDMTESARLTASDEPGSINAEKIGFAVCITGKWIAVGAPGDSTPEVQNSGAAYIFERTGTNWADANETRKFQATDHGLNSLHTLLDANSETILSRAIIPYPNSRMNIFIYKNSEKGWNQIRKFECPAPLEIDAFGRNGRVEGDTIAITAWSDNDLGSNSGSIYVYGKDQGGTDNGVYTVHVSNQVYFWL